MSASYDVLAVVGPTAAGKTAHALQLAQDIGGEVINADAFQLYRDLNIGTAKIAEEEQRGVRHHLLDLWDIQHRASVVEYQREARETIDAVRARDSVPILVGGSGLYVSAVIDQVEFPGTDPAIRTYWEERAERQGAEALHRVLQQCDADAAREILPSNRRRIVRALEVIQITGKPFQATLRGLAPHYSTRLIGVECDTDELDERIERRAEKMFADGLVEETQQLIAEGLRESPTASRAIGYQQVLSYLDGECTRDEALAATAAATRRLVRRQRSWFRRDHRIEWRR